MLLGLAVGFAFAFASLFAGPRWGVGLALAPIAIWLGLYVVTNANGLAYREAELLDGLLGVIAAALVAQGVEFARRLMPRAGGRRGRAPSVPPATSRGRRP